jgi:hypothetical protein
LHLSALATATDTARLAAARRALGTRRRRRRRDLPRHDAPPTWARSGRRRPARLLRGTGGSRRTASAAAGRRSTPIRLTDLDPERGDRAPFGTFAADRSCSSRTPATRARCRRRADEGVRSGDRPSRLVLTSGVRRRCSTRRRRLTDLRALLTVLQLAERPLDRPVAAAAARVTFKSTQLGVAQTPQLAPIRQAGHEAGESSRPRRRSELAALSAHDLPTPEAANGARPPRRWSHGRWPHAARVP